MKSISQLRSERGSALIVAAGSAVILTIAAIAALDYAMYAIRNSIVIDRTEEAKTVANNEMEHLFYTWTLNAGDSRVPVEDYLGPISSGGIGETVARPTVEPWTAASDPILYASLTPLITDPNGQTTVARELHVVRQGSASAGGSLTHLTKYYAGAVLKDPDPEFGVSGLLNSKSAAVRFYKARTYVKIHDASLNRDFEARLGRRFALQKVSAFNFALFYQGDLEIRTGSDMAINGNIECNGSVYLSSSSSSVHLIINNIISYLNQYNGDANPTVGNTLALVDNSATYQPPTFSDSRLNQVKKMTSPDLFIGNVDPAALASNPLYNVAYPTQNDVYRSLVSPDRDPVSGAPLTEDPIVKNNRMYNKAGLRIMVKTDGTVWVTDPAINPTPDSGHNYAADFSTPTPVATVLPGTVQDAREQKPVRITEIAIDQLNAAIGSTPRLKADGTPMMKFIPELDASGQAVLDSVTHQPIVTQVPETLADAYNGVVYAFDESTSITTPAAIRLVNGTSTPNYNGQGFTLATDNALYVKGDYNTAEIDPINHVINRAALMADAVTVLSPGWDDSKANGLHTSVDSGSSYPDQYRGATANITVNSAIISGNTPTVVTPPAYSGGANNLVRYLEDWGGKTVIIQGSVDQLFTSKHFNSTFVNRGNIDPVTGKVLGVYWQPANRIMQFDPQLAANPPGGAPYADIQYYRGQVFDW